MCKYFQFILVAVLVIAAYLAAPVKAYSAVDLSIESARVEPTQGPQGTAFTFAVLIKNRGTTQAKMQSGCFRYRLSTDLSYNSTDVKNPTPQPYILNPGQTVECKGQPKTALPSGLVSVEFIVQPDISTPDNVNDNNRYFIQVPVANASGSVTRPELYLSKTPSFSSGSAAAKYGEELSLYANIGNRGDADAMILPGTVLWNVTEAGKIIAEDKNFNRNTLITKGTVEYGRWLKIPMLSPGFHDLVINLDPKNAIQEKNETHASMTARINIQVVNLAVSMQTIPGKTYSVRDVIPIGVTVRNQGNATAVFPAGTHFLYYGAKGKSVNKMILNNNVVLNQFGEYKTTLMLQPFTATPGVYDIEVWVDPVNVVRDINLADNRASIKMNLTAATIAVPKQPNTRVVPGAAPIVTPPHPPIKP